MHTLSQAAAHRILILDGAMGTQIQLHRLAEKQVRGHILPSDTPRQQGNNDLLSLTQPHIIQGIHRTYLRAGADIITANTFCSQRISQAEYGCAHLVEQMNTTAVKLAREAVDECSTSQWPRFVMATMGPTSKSLAIGPDVDDPARRAITYAQLRDAYLEQALALLRAGVDGIMVETCFDTLNAKAALDAVQSAMETTNVEVPLMLSLTANDATGRILSGQSLEALLVSVAHVPLFSIGLNCSFGPEGMLQPLRTLAALAPCAVSVHPNAGLPDALGHYTLSPAEFAQQMARFTQAGMANIVGGCCGTTPAHIAALRPLLAHTPRQIPAHTTRAALSLSGLEPLVVHEGEPRFVNVGERCNVAGSRRFLRLIREKAYDEALQIARQQVEDGAMMLDINMDDGLLDAAEEMTHFLQLLASEPEVSRVPLMLDSSEWTVLSQAMKCVQGKCVLNSISLKEGEAPFVAHAAEAKRMGAAVVVMAFDEMGQADTYERRIAVCQRAYRLLTEQVGMDARDIIFDPNILAVATGMPEHDGYALDFIRATSWIRQHLPHTHVSGGVSNLSFSFRGNNYLREAMHAVFLYHAIEAGMDMAIVNPATRLSYADIPPQHLAILTDVMLHPSAQATEALIQLAASLSTGEGQSELTHEPKRERTDTPVATRLSEALMQGCTTHLHTDIAEALALYPRAVDVIEGPLMQGMNQVGGLFAQGKMFLPQVVRAARTMKQAVALLEPYIKEAKEEKGANATTLPASVHILLATVKGDVHDIGKNIVAVVLACAGYRVTDLGVMVPAEEIVRQAQALDVDAIGLSGLITPSLAEMTHTAQMLDQAGIAVPLMIGGATTSALHTALRIAPVYHGPVIWTPDASQNVPLLRPLLDKNTRAQAIAQLSAEQEALRQAATTPTLCTLDEARARQPKVDWDD